ncbi:MAG: hypothetical protein ACOX42_10985 [Clostridia bacterium]|jgi:hypothetical protein
MVTTLDGFVTVLVITSAIVNARKSVCGLISAHLNITLIGAKGYSGTIFSADLKNEKDIYPLPIKRKSSKS